MELTFKNLDFLENNNYLVSLTKKEEVETEGGIAPLALFLAIGAGAAAGVAIYEAGKAVGEFVYYVSH